MATKIDLKALLIKACPPDSEGNRSPRLLARTLGISHQSVYKWINKNKIPAERAAQIVNVCKTKRRVGKGRSAPWRRISLKQFGPFVFGS